MSNAHPWLEQIPWTTKPLPRDMLEHRIQRALTLTNLGMLGTLGLKGPIVSPLEFYADKFTIYIFPQPGSPKLKAMERDPRVLLQLQIQWQAGHLPKALSCLGKRNYWIRGHPSGTMA